MSELMYLTEQHYINKSHPYFKDCDNLAWLSKNLYNSVLYIFRLEYFRAEKAKDKASYPHYSDINKRFITVKNPDYYAMNTKMAQWTIRNACNDWYSWLKAIKAYWKDPSKFKAKPGIPNYADKETGRKTVILTPQAVSRLPLREGFIRPAGTEWMLPYQNKGKKIQEVRIVPVSKYLYKVAIVYLQAPCDVIPDENGEVSIASCDLGVNNLAAVAIRKGEYSKGILINGLPLKQINQWYNREIAKLHSLLEHNKHTSLKIIRLYQRRRNKITDYMHKASTMLVNILQDNHVAKFVIGKNDGWKQDINLGDKNNQNFVQVPFNKFIHMVTYKANLKGIEVVLTEEAYTSQASSVDQDQLFCFGDKPDNFNFSGQRKHRGLYITKDKLHINADMNGAVNIMRKVIQDVEQSVSWIRGCVVSPVKYSIALG